MGTGKFNAVTSGLMGHLVCIQALPLFFFFCGRCGGLTVGALVPGASGPGSSPGWGHCVVFLVKTLNSHSVSLHPGV